MHAEMKRTHVWRRDVLLNITGASIGRSTFVPEDFGEGNVNQHVCIIRTGWWLDPFYLSSFLNSPLGQDQIFSTESGVTREGLNYGMIRGLKVPLAPLLEQDDVVKKIAVMFTRAYTVEKTVQEGLKQIESLEQSILAKAFRGELVPQDPDDEPASLLLERIRRQGTTIAC
jgi:type I restriction enzyme S subunit